MISLTNKIFYYPAIIKLCILMWGFYVVVFGY